jgi:flagellar biosynthesis protein FlhG
VKPLSEQTHYEVLEIPRTASPEEVERAYRLAAAVYGETSLGHYSVFGAEDVEALRARIEAAYDVLRDADARRAYDAEFGAAEEDEVAALLRDLAPAVETPELPEAAGGFGDAEALAEEKAGDFDGARLRRARLRRGIELDQIASVTKINPTYLRFLEEERFADLPAAVYVRGFVGAYARCLGLDPSVVASSYMERYEEQRERPKRPRRLGRAG